MTAAQIEPRGEFPPVAISLPTMLKLAVWLVLGTAALIAINEYRTPAPLDANAAAGQFSAERAVSHLQQIAAAPHFVGTDQNHHVRDYLVQQLTALGADVKVEDSVGIQGRGHLVNAASVQNIVAKFSGAGSTQAVMLAAHYDSVERAPGAGDDGAGVITILETLRALRADPALKNEILVVLTDGEEAGLLGASAFVADHPALKEYVRIVLNFEGRGNSGPVVMFETSEGNGWLISEFSGVVPYPVASSLTYAAYKMLPNDTDMTVFKRAGLQGMNFAFVGGFQNYHSRLDTAQNLDHGTIQHMGSYALVLTRRFGNIDLQNARQPDRIYFNWLGSRLVHYQHPTIAMLHLVVFALFLASFVIASRRGMITIGRSAAGLGGFILLLLVTIGATGAGWWLLARALGDNPQIGDAPGNQLILGGLLLLATALAVLLEGWLAARLGWLNVATGNVMGVFALSLAAAIKVSGASYILQWPLVFALAGILLALFTRNRNLALFWCLLGAIPAVLLFAPLMVQLLTLLSLNSISVVVVAAVFAILLAVISPLLSQLALAPRRTFQLMLAASMCLLVMGYVGSAPSTAHPHPDTIFYAEDAGAKKAAWASYDQKPDSFTSQFLGKNFHRGQEPGFTIGSDAVVLSNAVSPLGLEAPSAQVTGDVVVGDGRMLRLHLASPRHANGIAIRFPSTVKIASLKWNGREFPIVNDRDTVSSWLLRYLAVPAQGVDLELHLASRAPVQCWIGDRSFGLPQVPGQVFAPRPEIDMAWYGSDVTVVDRQFTF